VPEVEPIQPSLAQSTSRWPEIFRKLIAVATLARNSDDRQHPFGNPATGPQNRGNHATGDLALGFAPQPCDWFAFSRMMTQQAVIHRKLLFSSRV
jgi:hypothetical protein